MVGPEGDGGVLRVRWRRPLHQQGSGTTLAVGDGCVVVHERDTRLVGLDAATGAARWDVRVGRWPRAVVVDGDLCWVIAQDPDRLDCRALATGDPVWSAALPPYTGHLVAVGEMVLVGGWRGYTPLRAVDRRTGRLRWRGARPAETVLPAAAGGHALVATPGAGAVCRIDLADGRETDHWSVSGPVVAGGDGQWPTFGAVGEDRFLVRVGRTTVWEIRPGGGSARVFFDDGTALAPDAPAVAGGVVWLGDADGGLVAVDAATGRLRRRTALRHPALNQVAAVGRRFVVPGRSGVLTLLDAAGEPRARLGVDRRITALYAMDARTVLVVGRASLTAVEVLPDRADPLPSGVAARRLERPS